MIPYEKLQSLVLKVFLKQPQTQYRGVLEDVAKLVTPPKLPNQSGAVNLLAQEKGAQILCKRRLQERGL